MTTRAAIYFRRSKADPDCVEQGDAIELVQRRSWSLVDTFFDEERTSTKARSRPGIAKLLIAARARRFDALVVSRIDRIFGSLHELVVVVDTLRENNIEFVSAAEFAIDTTRNRGLFELVEAFASFERTIRVGRTRLGLELARHAGKKLGRPRKRFDYQRAVELYRRGESYSAIARQLGVTKHLAYRRLRGREAVAKTSLH